MDQVRISQFQRSSTLLSVHVVLSLGAVRHIFSLISDARVSEIRKPIGTHMICWRYGAFERAEPLYLRLPTSRNIQPCPATSEESTSSAAYNPVQ